MPIPSSGEVLFEAPTLRLQHVAPDALAERAPHPGFLYTDWRGYVSTPQVKAGIEALARALDQTGADRLVNDNRHLRGSWTQAVPWLERVGLPLLLARGLREIAFVYAPAPGARQSVDRLLEASDAYTAQTFEELDEAVAWACAADPPEAAPRVGEHLAVREGGAHVVLQFDAVRYAEADGHGAVVHTTAGAHRVGASLKELERRLPPGRFARVHRSVIVNLDHLSHLRYYMGGAYRAYLDSDERTALPVSRTRAPALKRRLGI